MRFRRSRRRRAGADEVADVRGRDGRHALPVRDAVVLASTVRGARSSRAGSSVAQNVASLRVLADPGRDRDRGPEVPALGHRPRDLQDRRVRAPGRLHHAGLRRRRGRSRRRCSETPSNPALSIAATALVALLFGPVRERVRRFANRLVYGKRATPYEVMAGFAHRVTGRCRSSRSCCRRWRRSPRAEWARGRPGSASRCPTARNAIRTWPADGASATRSIGRSTSVYQGDVIGAIDVAMPATSRSARARNASSPTSRRRRGSPCTTSVSPRSSRSGRASSRSRPKGSVSHGSAS